MFVIENDLGEITKIVDALEQYAEEHGIDNSCVSMASVCIDEILANIILYAYDDEEVHKIEVEFAYSQNEQTLAITVIDDGKEFNPLEQETPNLSTDIMEREVGGLGIFIVRNTMEDVKYKRMDEKNCLTMTKKV